MMRTSRLVVAAVAVVVLAGCSQSADGTPVSSSAAEPVTTTGTTTRTSGAAGPTGAPLAGEVPGVVPTSPDVIPPNALICMPRSGAVGEATRASVSDPAAPRLTITVPAGWTATPGEGSTALTLQGPDGAEGLVSIAETDLEPAAAFTAYNDEVFGRSDISVVNTLPAEFCGFSSQRLFGSWGDMPGGTVEFSDRITHIWTNTGKYLVTIHLQGPDDSAAVESAKDTLLADFPIVIP